MKNWVIMRSYHTKEFIRCLPEKASFLRSIGWKDAWEFYREKFNEREVLVAQLNDEMAEIRKQIDEIERKK